MVAERFSDDLGHWDTVILGPACESFLQFGSRRTDSTVDRAASSEDGRAAAPGDDLVDVVASCGRVGKLVNEVVDRAV